MNAFLKRESEQLKKMIKDKIGNYERIEDLQNQCDISIGMKSDFFNEYIKNEKVEPQKVNYSKKYNKIFIYSNSFTKLVDYMKNNCVVLECNIVYIGNSDYNFTSDDCEDLERLFRFKSAFVQNLLCEHYNNIYLMPIMLENRMWKSEKPIYNRFKTRDFLCALRHTHESRNIIPSLEIENENLSKVDYYKKLSESRYCVCIRGNGVDTHRFWESLMSGTIPIYIITDFESMLFEQVIRENFRDLNFITLDSTGKKIITKKKF